MKNRFYVLCVGSGEQMTESLIPALQAIADEGVVIPALVDPQLEVARRWAQHFGIPAIYPDLASALGGERVDAVVIAAPHKFHHELAAMALAAGKHVLLEKPFTESGQQARDLIRLAGGHLVLTPNFQYPVQHQTALTRLARGECGTVRRGAASWLRVDGIPDRPSFWNTPLGGVGPDLLSHLLSVVLPAIGTAPVAVTAQGSNHRGRARYGARFVAYDTLAGTVLFQGGRQAWLEASWCADVPEDEIVVKVQGDDARMVIPLMAAELDVDRFVPVLYHALPESTGPRRVFRARLDTPLPTATEACFVLKMRNWIGACRGEEELRVGADLGLAVRLVLDAFQTSAAADGKLTPIAGRVS